MFVVNLKLTLCGNIISFVLSFPNLDSQSQVEKQQYLEAENKAKEQRAEEENKAKEDRYLEHQHEVSEHMRVLEELRTAFNPAYEWEQIRKMCNAFQVTPA